MNEGNIERDLHLLADNHTAAFERGIPCEAVVLAVDLGLSSVRGALLTVRVLHFTLILR